MTNAGKWQEWYTGLDPAIPQPYADTPTYAMGAEWLADCAAVEDWGCGMGWMRRLVVPAFRYRGVDGTASPFADVVVDLEDYTSSAPGIFMRHVLEHNVRWRVVLDNALASFTQRMALVLFTPMAEETGPIAPFDNGIDVPNIAFRPSDLEERFTATGVQWSAEDVPSASFYGVERVYLLERVR